jgi:tetratricopeptide (TPR) repeat protein
MKKNHIILWLLLLTVGIQPVLAETPVGNPDKLFRMGVKKYSQEQYQEGLDLFKSALTNMPAPASFDVSLIHYNLGVGYYRLNQPDEAATSFSLALKTSDINLQEKAYYNLGDTLYQMAQQALNDGEIAKAFQTFQSAQTNFMQTLRLNSTDQNAKVNFELSTQAQIKILQMVAMAMSQLQQGDQMVGAHKFTEAAQWFQENLPMAKKALEVEPDKQKLFETMTQRSSEVAEIITKPEGGLAP